MQIILDPFELEQFRKAAIREKKTLSEWVRTTLRRQTKKNPAPSTEDPIEVFRGLELPSPPIEKMLQEIEKGRQ